MRRAHWAAFVGFVIISFAIVAVGKSTTRSGGFTELHRVEVADTPDLELVMGLIERVGESTGGKHYHPGGEFGFVLEGSIGVTTENEQLVTRNAGTSFYQPPGEWHIVNTDTEGAKTLVFRVLKKGQPMIVAVD